MNTETDALLPCPFCEAALLDRRDYSSPVGAPHWQHPLDGTCIVRGMMFADEPDFRTAWNRRPTSSPVQNRGGLGDALDRAQAALAGSKTNAQGWSKPAPWLALEYRLEELINRCRSLPAASNGGAGEVGVKALEWEQPSSKNNHCWVARTILGNYCVACEGGWWFAGMDEGFRPWDWEPPQDARSYSGPEAFMAACEADWQERIRSALVPAAPSAADPRLAHVRYECAQRGPCSDNGDGCTCDDATLGKRYGFTPRPAPSAPGAIREAALPVDALAQIIRQVDGNNSLGAGALAEAILAAPGFTLPVPVDAGWQIATYLREAQNILAEYIVPNSGVSDTDCVNRLLGVLDREDVVLAVRAALKGAR